MTREIVEEIFEEIKKANSELGENSIPRSDELIKFLTGSLSEDAGQIRQAINILKNAHMIFGFELISEDTIRDTPSILGYVVAETKIIRELKSYFQNQLVILYNDRFHKNVMPHQAIKEIFPMMGSLNNTEIGVVANKAIMLEEFDRMLEKDYAEYLGEWKEKQLDEECEKINLAAKKKAKESGASEDEEKTKVEIPEAKKKIIRAIDSNRFKDFSSKSKKYPLDRLIAIYGIDFFYRIYLRKNEFRHLKKLIDDKQIKKRSDLLHLKELLRTVKKNIGNDPKFQKSMDDIYKLERSITHNIYFTGS